MPLQPVYLVAAKNLTKFLEAVRHAQTPEKLNLKFVSDLGFTSTNDRLFIPLLKALRFLDDTGKPTARYHSFLDDTQWKHVLADGIRDAYPDLFRINRNAHAFSREQLTGKIKSLGEGKIGDATVKNTVKTFLELVKLADFSVPSSGRPGEQADDDETDNGTVTPPPVVVEPVVNKPREQQSQGLSAMGLVYRIEIVLPAVRDQAVYDAIFRSARQHLLG